MFANSKRFCEPQILCPLIAGIVVGYCLTQMSYHKRQIAVVENHYQEKFPLAKQLKKDVRILCLVVNKNNSRQVKLTWGKRCNILKFMSSTTDRHKLKRVFKNIFKRYHNRADWFFKANANTYAVVENMRFMLYPLNPENPVHVAFPARGNKTYGARYILSREAFRRLVFKGIPNPNMCLPGTDHDENVEINECMNNLNVTTIDARRLHQSKIEDSCDSNYNTTDLANCASDTAFAFRHLTFEQLYTWDYFIYRLKPFGIVKKPMALSSKLSIDELLAD